MCARVSVCVWVCVCERERVCMYVGVSERVCVAENEWGLFIILVNHYAKLWEEHFLSDNKCRQHDLGTGSEIVTKKDRKDGTVHLAFMSASPWYWSRFQCLCPTKLSSAASLRKGSFKTYTAVTFICTLWETKLACVEGNTLTKVSKGATTNQQYGSTNAHISVSTDMCFVCQIRQGRKPDDNWQPQTLLELFILKNGQVRVCNTFLPESLAKGCRVFV